MTFSLSKITIAFTAFTLGVVVCLNLSPRYTYTTYLLNGDEQEYVLVDHGWPLEAGRRQIPVHGTPPARTDIYLQNLILDLCVMTLGAIIVGGMTELVTRLWGRRPAHPDQPSKKEENHAEGTT